MAWVVLGLVYDVLVLASPLFSTWNSIFCCVFFRCFANHTRQSSYHIFTIVDHCDLTTNQIIPTWRDYSVTYSFEKVKYISELVSLNLPSHFLLSFLPLVSLKMILPSILRGVLVSCMFSYNLIGAGYQFDYVFDWTILKYPQVGSSSRARVSTSHNCWQVVKLFFVKCSLTCLLPF